MVSRICSVSCLSQPCPIRVNDRASPAFFASLVIRQNPPSVRHTSMRRWRQTLPGDNPESPPSKSTFEIEKESAKSKRHTGSSWQGWCICVFLLSRHILSTLAPVELHAKLVEHIQKGPEYQWRAYIATVVRYHVRPQWPILGQGKESRNLPKAERSQSVKSGP